MFNSSYGIIEIMIGVVESEEIFDLFYQQGWWHLSAVFQDTIAPFHQTL